MVHSFRSLDLFWNIKCFDYQLVLLRKLLTFQQRPGRTMVSGREIYLFEIAGFFRDFISFFYTLYFLRYPINVLLNKEIKREFQRARDNRLYFLC